MPVVTTAIAVATAVGYTTGGALAFGAITGGIVYGAATVATNMYASHQQRKATKNAAHDADMRAQQLKAEQELAAKQAEERAIEEAKARRRAFTRTIYSQDSEYELGKGVTTLGV